jgi:hypothetical protein
MEQQMNFLLQQSQSIITNYNTYHQEMKALGERWGWAAIFFQVR